MLKRLDYNKIIMFLIGMAIIFSLNYLISAPHNSRASTNAYLLKPISDQMLLITSAGQSTDTYILQDIANDLRLNNLFMPEATKKDISDVSAIIIVVGYSETGIKLHDKDIDKEYERITELIASAHVQELPIITVYLGGSSRRNEKTDELLQLTCTGSDFIICTASGNSDDYIGSLAEKGQIPISFIDSINDLTKPLASVFR